MAKKYTWNITLRPNAFTPDNDRDQLADVVPAGTKKDEDITLPPPCLRYSRPRQSAILTV